MTATSRPSRWEWLVGGTPALVAVASRFAGRDPFEATKLALLSLLLTALVGIAVVSTGRRGTGRWPVSPWSAALGLFLAVAGIATLLADNTAASFFGVPSRQIGWLLYGTAGGLGMLAAVASGRTLVDAFRRSMLAALVLLGVYALLQVLGAEPFPVSSSVSGVFVTLSNPNFAGAWGGSLLGLAALTAIDSRAAGWERGVAAAGIVAAILIVGGAGSVVGVVAAGVSTMVALGAWVAARGGTLRRVGLPALGVTAVIAAVLGALGTFELGPLARLGSTTGVVLRRFYWDAALVMGVDQPLTGVGFDRFVRFYRLYRSPAAADRVDVTIETDAAHSVPMQMLSGGGFPLLLAWLLLVGVSLWAAVRAYRRAEGLDRLVVAGLASVWAGVTVQSLASFDVAALLTLSMVSAGMLAGMAWPDAVASFVLPGSDVTTVQRRKRTATSVRPPAWAVPAAWTAAGVLVVAGLGIGTKPLRAELRASDGLAAVAAQQPQLVQASWSAASEVAPWEVDYPYREGLGMLQLGELDEGVAAFGRALSIQPDHVGSLVSRARALEALQRRDEAEQDYVAALAHEPHHLDLKVEVALFVADSNRPLAEELLAEVSARDPDHEQLGILRERLALTPGD
ncbi:O-antigen ligase family protein [Euzebya rosea]|uniref:O-antigen ligase family protein n=1 Tax=Euzebya rosea TaxID=2052804 RepID=UPI0013004DDF|nr:O-antigen ligase family protein [Euzebya rosea]